MYRIIRKLFFYILSLFNISTFKNIDNHALLNLINLFKPYYLGYQLIRIGDNEDGGYLVPDCLNDISYCFSAGVGNKFSFEKQLANKGITSFMSDYSVDLKTNDKLLIFDKKYIKSFNDENSIEVNQWFKNKLKNNNDNINLIFQMDIEGHEYEVISSINEDILKKIRILIVEFHNLEYSGNSFVYSQIFSNLTKIKKYFEVAHIHPNNWKELTRIGKYKFPSALEVTFLNKNWVSSKEKINKLPHNLDVRNKEDKEDIILDNNWF